MQGSDELKKTGNVMEFEIKISRPGKRSWNCLFSIKSHEIAK